MLVLYEETVVLDRVAKGFNLVGDLRLVLECRVDCQIALIISMIKELNRARVTIAVDITPSALDCFHSLVDLPVEVDLLRLTNQISSGET
jgi:hypothetical protein